MNLVTETASGFWSLITGMRITIKEFFSPVITIQYPHQTLQITKKFRGHIELKWNDENGRANCTACGICAKACPSSCIELDGIKPEGEKKKTVTEYQLNFTLCSLCSLCVEACPFDAIQHSGRYNLASVPNQWADMNLVQRYKDQVIRAGKTPYIPETPAAAPASEAGRVVPAEPSVTPALKPAAIVAVQPAPAQQ